MVVPIFLRQMIDFYINDSNGFPWTTVVKVNEQQICRVSVTYAGCQVKHRPYSLSRSFVPRHAERVIV